jgi:S-DNA-T family DNA segregation ATPase FtsK/SpoIIIE
MAMKERNSGRKGPGKAGGRPEGRGLRFLRYCVVLVLVGSAAVAWISLVSYSPTDPPARICVPPKSPVDNAAGIVGAYVADALLYWLGGGAYMALLFVTLAAFILALGGRVRDVPWRILGVALLVTASSAAIYMAHPVTAGDPLTSSAGILGISVGQLLLSTCASTGGWIIVVICLALGLMLTADSLVLKLPSLGRKAWGNRPSLTSLAGAFGLGRPGVDVLGRGATTRPHARPAAMKPQAAPAVLSPRPVAAKAAAPAAARAAKTAAARQPPLGGLRPAEPKRRNWLLRLLLGDKGGAQPVADRPVGQGPGSSPAPVNMSPIGPIGPMGADKLAASPPVAASMTPAKLRPPVAEPPKFRQAARTEPARADRPEQSAGPRSATKGKGKDKSYDLPSTKLLEAPQRGYSEGQELVAQQRKGILQQTLNDFGVAAQVEGYQTGPVITMFELSLAPGVKVAQVANLCPDIARALAVPGIRIVSPLPGRDTIGIEVPNLEKEIVRISELMMSDPEAEKRMKLPLYFGKDASGEAIIEDLSRMPHMLIAGTTGSGKSVCINSIIMAILMTRRPEEVRLILVDPKMVEMAAFEQIPHLLCPIVNDMHHAEEILAWAAMKMDERYEVLKEAGVKNVAGFNKLSKEEIYKRFGAETDEDKLHTPTNMPYYVIIIDELADLVMTSSKEVEEHIIRISQKARAVGIHLILATQRPSANVVTGLIKSNMPCRVSFRVASRQESRIVLDQNGAEVLLGQGDMLFLRPGCSTLVRAQGTYVDDSEIHAIVEELKAKNGPPTYDAELVQLNSRPAGSGEPGERDELFNKGVEIVLASQRGSVSLLQRRLAVGYSRASRIIDQMAEAGLLGDYKGSQARECMITLEDWHAMRESIAADQSGASALNGEPTSA